ncbi:hypothetical protein DPMN_082804 [Dreissena polymorpha]|uniref:Uncharacterized protein n=1 Tax=Dreissena polymorpha TaxID=45954 RepID=A0A9D4BHN1_DREPO|nr:hypothetical protein DPMN_082804 [Dreissena polymorpha]
MFRCYPCRNPASITPATTTAASITPISVDIPVAAPETPMELGEVAPRPLKRKKH